ncbi:YceD family protein [Marinobacter sp. chi1]|uniref:Large ribosomal RNA subunit accumulation protein YceD n=1 Tax=Marinobacter suaedae TaxID=3057675 RepID=A0ABT8W311_9GAMM|nr:YceD family protein [Marinobacter sp. chi1]MDO3722628.1 YceD family protein [Marinobacter sp. chi1]
MSKASCAGLPKSVDPYKLAEQHSTLEGEIPLSALSRFREAVSEVSEDAVCSVTLSFYMDGERRRIVSGELKAPVILECQRCMGDMQVTLTSEFTLGLVTSDEQAQRLPKDLEPFLTDDFSADLWSMVEDELLLVLPPFPLHNRSECPAKEDLEALEPKVESEAEKAPAKENPFSVLADLKKSKH